MGANERGLGVHIARAHRDEKPPTFADRPQRVAPPPAAAPEPAAPPAPPVDLSAVGKDLATNIEAIGQLVHAALYMLKLRHVMAGRPPAVNTHLGFVIQLRAQLTADLLMDYAARNEAVMRFVLALNTAFRGGAAGQLVLAHAVAAGASIGMVTPLSQPLESALIPDVLKKVEEEDHAIAAAVMAMGPPAAAAAANGREGHE